jgi:hypothetical protein
MIEIAFTVCALVSPYNCVAKRQTYEAEQVSLHECVLYGQMELSKWVSEHPGWRIERWRCGVAGQMAKI